MLVIGNYYDPATQYETARIMNWLDHYLKGSSVGTGPNFAYFRDWVGYTGSAAPAYASAGSYPVGSRKSLYLSSADALVSAKSSILPRFTIDPRHLLRLFPSRTVGAFER